MLFVPQIENNMDLKSFEIYKAVINCTWSIIDKFVANGGDINASLLSAGPEAGYTALHFAVIQKSSFFVERLIRTNGANVNCVAMNGAQPIHLALACLCNNLSIAEILLKFGANVDAKVNKEFVQKYSIYKNWCDDFGDTMTLLSFAVVTKQTFLIELLLRNKADVEVKDENNNTLLMYYFDNNYHLCPAGLELIEYMKNNPDLINTCNNDGLHVVHYLLSDKFCLLPRYHTGCNSDFIQWIVVKKLIAAGADINVMLNDNPDTLLINIAAFKFCSSVLTVLLDLDVPISVEAKPLQYVKLPFDRKKYFQRFNNDDNVLREEIEQCRNDCIKIILESFALRREFGFFVPKDEQKLMDEMVAVDPKFRKIICDFQERFINRTIKDKKIEYGDKTITLYDFAVNVFDDKRLKLLVKDEGLVQSYQKFYADKNLFKTFEFCKVINDRISRAYKRRKLKKKVGKIPQLLESILLPYEIILDIIDHLENDNLETFVSAFYKDSI